MSFLDYGISVTGASGEVKTTCPKCSFTRKKKNDRCLSVNLDKEIWNCFHCGWKGSLKKTNNFKKFEEVVIVKPEPPKKGLPENIYQWFENRGITRSVVDGAKIGYDNRWIHFPFYKDGEVVNIKSRTGDKRFRQSKNAEKCFYRFDNMKGMETIIITEGEMDALSLP